MKTITNYSEEFKQSAVEKLLAPGAPTLAVVARKVSVAPSTLYGWKQKYANQSVMKKTKNRTNHKWSPEQKQEAIGKTFSMNENELGEFLRTTGLHSSDLEAFKTEALEGFKSKGRPKLDPEIATLRKRNKAIERDLKRTQKALAEQSARIILLKKSHEIWGTPESEDDE